MLNPRSTALLAALVLTASATANETYFTTGITSGSFDGTAPVGCTLTESSASGVGGTLGVGYRFSDPFAIEFGYQTFGSLDLAGICGITPVVVNAPDSGLSASGVGRLKFDRRWSLLGRVGFYSWSGGAESGTETVLGVGAEYEWNKGVAARLEYSTIGSDVDALSVTFRFGF